MTIMTTTFIPCGAKLPFIAMIAGALFGGSAGGSLPPLTSSAWPPSSCSGIMLKKTKMFAGDPAPFVMELPAYHWPTVGNVLRSMWERGWSFIKKAGTIILLSTIFVWFTTYFGFVDGTFGMLDEIEIDYSILAAIGGAICWIFQPSGLGQLAGHRGFHHRPDRQGEHCRHAGYPLRRRRRANRLYSGQHAACLHRPLAGYCLPGLQPAVRSLLRRHRRHQAGDEQRTSGPGLPSAISAASPICVGLCDLPAGYAFHPVTSASALWWLSSLSFCSSSCCSALPLRRSMARRFASTCKNVPLTN